jgi:ABC-type amino acid transport system permease subunit
MEILDDDYTRNELTEEGGNLPYELFHNWTLTGKWTVFLAILGFIFTGLFALVGSLAGTMVTLFAQLETAGNPVYSMISRFFQYGILGVLIVVGILAFYYYFLYQFGSNLQNAVRYKNQSQFEQAWVSYRNYVRMSAILIGIGMLLYIVAMVLFAAHPYSTPIPIAE